MTGRVRGTVTSVEDERWMRRALALARRGEGAVAPNPMVGAVLVRSGQLLAEGWHRIFGGAHAEHAALRLAGDAARGATLFINLEPCAHQGKTPPCAQALRSAGISRVVVSHRDPNPRVSGRGLRVLRRAGIQVQTGVLEDAARQLNETYFFGLRHGLPQVILKAGTSLDGRIAGPSGHSHWVTSAAARQAGRRWRRRVDAVVVGGGTARTDDPLLSAREGGRPCRRQPLRVVVAGRRWPGPRARFLLDGAGPVLIYGSTGFGDKKRVLERAGAEVVEVPGEINRPDVREILVDLAHRGVTSVLVEGGGEVSWSFLKQGLVDRLVWYVSPLIMGGGGIPVVGGPGVTDPGEGVRLLDMKLKRVGPDLEVTARPENSRH